PPGAKAGRVAAPAPGSASAPAAPVAAAVEAPGEASAAATLENEPPGAGSIQPPAGAGPRLPAERFLVLAPGGPLVVDARITLDGVPLADAYAAGETLHADRAAEAAKAADPTAPRAAMRASAADKRPPAVTLRSTRSYAPDPRASSRIWPLLDTDGDGRVGAPEIAGAAEQLWLRDADDNRVLVPAELAPLRAQLDGAADSLPATSSGGAGSARVAAISLSAAANFERVEFILQDLYAPQQDFTPESFPLLPELFAQLDANGDQWLEREELKRLLTVEPHLEVAVAFSEAEERHAAQLAIERAGAGLEQISRIGADGVDRKHLRFGGAELILAAVDLTPAASGAAAPARGPAEAPERHVVQVRVHDRGDALFDRLDSNGDGRLGERELAGIGGSLAPLDANGDGALEAAEAPYAMTFAVVRGAAAGSPPFVPLPSTAPRAGVSPPGWFSHADLNRDGDISPREFLGTAEQLRRLDANGNGFVDRAEAGSAPRAH
ncbi:MAG TPA: EF-hand domain-containing protein, partial [Lacipirellulaceae bacterium]|nr:EF-hand domain-containing protein [Lacipirellulaceae bacterium]